MLIDGKPRLQSAASAHLAQELNGRLCPIVPTATVASKAAKQIESSKSINSLQDVTPASACSHHPQRKSCSTSENHECVALAASQLRKPHSRSGRSPKKSLALALQAVLELVYNLSVLIHPKITCGSTVIIICCCTNSVSVELNTIQESQNLLAELHYVSNKVEREISVQNVWALLVNRGGGTPPSQHVRRLIGRVLLNSSKQVITICGNVILKLWQAMGRNCCCCLFALRVCVCVCPAMQQFCVAPLDRARLNHQDLNTYSTQVFSALGNCIYACVCRLVFLFVCH